jgi:hypothetical protein
MLEWRPEPPTVTAGAVPQWPLASRNKDFFKPLALLRVGCDLAELSELYPLVKVVIRAEDSIIPAAGRNTRENRAALWPRDAQRLSSDCYFIAGPFDNDRDQWQQFAEQARIVPKFLVTILRGEDCHHTRLFATRPETTEGGETGSLAQMQVTSTWMRFFRI